jgi:hypothetical protein
MPMSQHLLNKLLISFTRYDSTFDIQITLNRCNQGLKCPLPFINNQLIRITLKDGGKTTGCYGNKGGDSQFGLSIIS